MFDFDDLDDDLRIDNATREEECRAMTRRAEAEVRREEERGRLPNGSTQHEPLGGAPRRDDVGAGGAASGAPGVAAAAAAATTAAGAGPADRKLEAVKTERLKEVANAKAPHSDGVRGDTLCVPWVPPVRGVSLCADSRVLEWMAQKCRLKQDMFLIGDPGPHLRQLVLQFASMHGRELEYVGITRDTTEADLKQRREIHGGHLRFYNSPAVEAALRGRILVLEGIEKAERNVLPVLNNLLENREMSLEDGSFLMAPGREAEIEGAAAGGRRLLPVSPDFVVIALGVPVPKYPGSPLDPPLRSRLAARSVWPMAAADYIELLQSVAGGVSKEAIKRLVMVVSLWQSAGDPTASGDTQAVSKASSAALDKAPRLPRFPEFGLLSVVRLLSLFPKLTSAAALHAAFPWTLLRLSDDAQHFLTRCLSHHKLDYSSAASQRAYTADGAERSAGGAGVARARLEAEGQGRVVADCPCGDLALQADAVSRLTASQRALLAQLLQNHCVGMDVCLVGERGSGKTAVARAFAHLLGYRVYTVFCFKDMTARDLTQRRSTDPHGNTTWHLSPIMAAAANGGVAVLDGVHRLPRGALAGVLGRLLCDRALSLADGTRFVPAAQWDQWLQAGATEADLHRRGLRRVHPSFRILATAEPPDSGREDRAWLDDETLALFHFVEVGVPSQGEQLRLVRFVSGLGEDLAPIRGLAAFAEALRGASKADPTLEPMILSVRQLIHAGRRLAQRPQAVDEAVRSALSAYVHFLPPLTRESVGRMLGQAMGSVGIKFSLHDDKQLGEASRAARLAQERGEQLKDLEEPAISLRFRPNPRVEQQIADKTRELQKEAEAEKGRLKAQVMQEAHASLAQHGRTKPSAAGGQLSGPQLGESEQEIRIGDVRVQKRRPARPELVPRTHFVDIPQHVAALSAMLIDWSLGRHLLLIGNQGVGKNKLADRFLGLLRIEREYLQLHRDTTVQSLTLQPSLKGGVVVFEDSPLVSAVRHGRVLVIDEADKAPVEVVCILKSLAEDGEFTLSDGRTIIRHDCLSQRSALGTDDPAFLPMDEGFRMIVLANRPGFPFLGNDFYRECGDVFASHVVDNPDVRSEVQLLRSYGPSVPESRIVQLLGLFSELRQMSDDGTLAYPYSTRELVRLVQHFEAFPDDSLEDVLSNVFAFDWHDKKLRETLTKVLSGAGAGGLANRATAFKHGDPNKTLPEGFKSAKHWDSGENAEGDGVGSNPGNVGTRDYDDAEDRSGKRHAPRAGNWDGRQHLGEGPWDGGSGGTGTAGIGGRAGPYRMDVGQELVMLSEEQKKEVSEEWHRQAKKMADEAYAHRLQELRMNPHGEKEYSELRDAVAAQISAMRIVLQSHEAKERERSWQKNRTHGELDEGRIVDGIVGSQSIYRRRAEEDAASGRQELPKRVRFVMDISGSMYTFNRIDQRLKRLGEVAVFLIESFAGFEHKYSYSMVGHSGTGPEAELLVPWGKPPTSPSEQLALVKRMAAHAQYAHSGDHTLQATDLAIKDVIRKPGDEHYVFVVSDADLARYGIQPEAWDKILMQDSRVNAYVLLISSNTDEAEQIKGRLSPGHGFICDNNDLLAVTFKQILQTTMLRNKG